jgi:hypothetical protein
MLFQKMLTSQDEFEKTALAWLTIIWGTRFERE